MHMLDLSRFRPFIRSLPYIGPYWRSATLAYALMVISVVAQLAIPQIVQVVMDALTYGVASESVGSDLGLISSFVSTSEEVLIGVIILIIAFAVIYSSFAFAQTFLTHVVSHHVAFDMRNDLFAKIQHLSFSYHDRNQTGQLMIRATNDVGRLRSFLGQGLLVAVQSILTLTGALLILFLTNWRLAMIFVPLLPLMLVMFIVFGTRLDPLYTELQHRLSRMNTVLQESVAGIMLIKAFTREPARQKSFDHSASLLMDQEIRLGKIYSLVYPAAFLIAYLCQAAIVYLGGRQIVTGTLTLGEWQKFILYLFFVFVPIGMLGFIISEMSQASVSARRIFEILDVSNEVADKPDALSLPIVQGNIVFEDVSFRYYASGKPVLTHVDLRVSAGQKVALLGATGSGKTTIINLIPRFYDVSEGRVKIDEHDVRDVTMASLRSNIGIVLQETTLFSGTIRDNIAYGRPHANMDDIVHAAKSAAAHEFITEFPAGYDSLVGERGTTLSGGQKQRIAIARVLLLDPRILILDDSTSSVDTHTESQIQSALNLLMAGRTSFVIAQRISTVQSADLILVLEKGGIVARGTHQDLLESSPEYADLYYSQLVDDSVSPFTPDTSTPGLPVKSSDV